MQSPLLLGELVVVALKAENLQEQGGRKQDPFCVFRISGQVKTTRIDHGGGAYPVWDDQVNIQLGQGQQHLLNVQIFDRDMNPNHFMGESNIDLAKVLREREHDGYFPLNLRGQPAGEIYLEMTFYPWGHPKNPSTPHPPIATPIYRPRASPHHPMSHHPAASPLSLQAHPTRPLSPHAARPRPGPRPPSSRPLHASQPRPSHPPQPHPPHGGLHRPSATPLGSHPHPPHGGLHRPPGTPLGSHPRPFLRPSGSAQTMTLLSSYPPAPLPNPYSPHPPGPPRPYPSYSSPTHAYPPGPESRPTHAYSPGPESRPTMPRPY